jgi:hypothetical protein
LAPIPPSPPTRLRLAALLLGAFAFATPVAAERGAAGWLPESCGPLLESRETGGAEERWNLHYRRGYDAIETGDLEAAERSLCRALAAARGFGPRDMRFAETLDELGLLNYLRGDDARAEAMQGAAAAEILLALGPPADDLPAEERDLCRSSVPTYLARLGQVYERQGRGALTADLGRAPYRILGMEYVPAPALAGRLEWLISRYLLTEDMPAADWLRNLRERLRTDPTTP